MKKLLLAVPWMAVACAHGQTNFPILNTLDGRSFTNVTVSRATPAYIIALYDGGGAKLYFTNLEPSVRGRFNFDAGKADAFSNGEAESRRKIQENIQAATEAELKAENAVGDTQKVKVLAHLEYYKYRISAGNQEVIFLNLPSSIPQFLDYEPSAPTESAAPKPQSKRAARKAAAAAAANAPNATDSKTMPNTASNNAAKLELDRLVQEKTTILARPTGKVVGGLRVWQFVGFPVTNATEAQRSP